MPTADQIRASYSGYAGWNDTAAIVADYKATGGAGKGNTPYRLGGNNAAPPVTAPAAPRPTNTAPAPTQNIAPSAPSGPGNPTSVQDLINMGYYGYQGWGDAGALADFKATGGQGKGGPTGGTGGIGTGIGTGQPTINLQEQYKSLFDTPEMRTMQIEADAKMEEYNRLKRELDEEEALIGDNPFAAESVLSGKIASLRRKGQVGLDKAMDEYNAAAGKIAVKKADAQFQLGLATQQYQIDSQEYQNGLARFNTLLSSGALSGMNGVDLANLSLQVGIPASMIQAAVQKQAEDSKAKPQMITSTNDAGMVTLTVVDSQTGAVISQKSLGAIGNAQGGGSGSGAKAGSQEYVSTATSALNQFIETKKNSYGHISPTDWQAAMSAFLQDALGTRDDFIKAYAAYTDPNRGDFDRAYGFSTGKRTELVEY